MAVKVHWFQIEPNLKEYEYQFTGLSTDEKPQDERVALNSLFLELDTGDFYYLKQQKSSNAETVFSETITTYVTPESPFYSPEYYVKIDADTINVVFDGVSYTIHSQLLNGGYMYGDFEEGEVVVPDFSRYPFLIVSFENDGEWDTTIALETNSAHTVEITEIRTTEAVWEKIGGGGGASPQPSEVVLWEGTLTASNAYEGGSGYMSDEPVEVSASFPNKITVVCNGVSYECSAYESEEYTRYGAPWDNGLEGFDFSEYPFHIINYADNEYGFIFANLGTYEIKIWANSEPLDTEPLIPVTEPIIPVGGDMNS